MEAIDSVGVVSDKTIVEAHEVIKTTAVGSAVLVAVAQMPLTQHVVHVASLRKVQYIMRLRLVYELYNSAIITCCCLPNIAFLHYPG